MDWSEILTEDESRYTQSVLDQLKDVSWAAPLLAEVGKRGGITFDNKSMLFEARVANALAKVGTTGVQYEFATGVKDSKVDFVSGRLMPCRLPTDQV